MTQSRAETSALRDELDLLVAKASGVPIAALADAGEQPLLELGLESLAVMELQAEVLARFGVRIPDESLEMSMPEIISYITAELDEGA